MALAMQVGLQRINVARQTVGLAVIVIAIIALDCITRLTLLGRTWPIVDSATTATATAVAPATWLTWCTRAILVLTRRLTVVKRSTS